jgi:hypothetical protein
MSTTDCLLDEGTLDTEHTIPLVSCDTIELSEKIQDAKQKISVIKEYVDSIDHIIALDAKKEAITDERVQTCITYQNKITNPPRYLKVGTLRRRRWMKRHKEVWENDLQRMDQQLEELSSERNKQLDLLQTTMGGMLNHHMFLNSVVDLVDLLTDLEHRAAVLAADQ